MQLADLKDYLDIDSAAISFQSEIYVAYAVCRKHCGNKEFISDGKTQVCQYCGHHMLHTVGEKYVIQEDKV
jgi:hypothetical protein